MRRHTTHFRKNQVKGLLLFSIITLTLFVGVSFLTSVAPTLDESVGLKSSSNLELPWSGTGDPQSARAYIQKLSSETDQTNDFDISVPTSPSILHSADLNFTILSGPEAVHEFEQDSPLEYPRSYENSRDNPDWSSSESSSSDSLSIDRGVETGLSDGFSGLVDESTGTALIIQNDTVSPADNEVTITYIANFTGVTNYDRVETVGFRIFADRSITKDVSANVYLYNYNSLSWDMLYTENWDNALAVEEISLPNERIAYLDSNNLVQVRIELTDQDAFTITYRDLKIEALIAVQAPISTLDYAAMEFDIMGDVNVSGFYAWVRTLTPSLPGADLEVKLYRSNQTARRADVTDPSEINLKPDTSTLISTNIITNFDTDEYVFIPFESDYSDVQLNVSNYFVVLSSDTSNIYAVATIPYSDADADATNNDPDLSVDHLFLTTDNGGVTWEKILVGGGQVDAAPFAINLTRPFLPEEIDMKVDGMEVVSIANTSGIYEHTSGYKWGLGNWDYEFESKIEDSSNTITVTIEYNSSVTTSLDFDVTYSAVVYAIESTTTNYYAELDGIPSWEVNYTLNTASYTGWNYINSSFAVPNDWVLVEFLDTSYTSLMDEFEYNVGEEIAEYWIEDLDDGVYSINASSPNYVFEMNTYLQYEEHYWETQGFMQGDNISLSLGILNFTKSTSEIFSGSSSCEVYDPDNLPLGSLTMLDVIPDDTKAVIVNNQNLLLTMYKFDSENLLNTTGATPKGEYSLVFKWAYGNEIGYKLLPIFIMDYAANITNIEEDVDQRVDVVRSSINRNLTTAETYNVSLFAVEDITGLPLEDTYHVNESIGHLYTDFDFNVNVSQILVNESLLNPGETVKVNITFENYNYYWANDVSINVQFIQSTNYEWIVMESSTFFELGMVGSGTENYTAELQFTIPSDFKGINGPIRLNPFVLMMEVNINGADLEPLYLDNQFPFIEKTESQFEGRVWMDSLIHYRPGPIGKILSVEIDRVEKLVHSDAIYLLQISDSYYVSCSNSEYDVFNSQPIAQFNDVTSVDLIWGREFQLQGLLSDEFGAVIDNQNISVDIYDGMGWIQYNQTNSKNLSSNNQGFFNGTYDSSVISKADELQIRLTWAGNSTLYGTSSDYDFSMITYDNQIQIEIVNATDQIFLKEKQENTIQFKITNTGNSTLIDFDIDFNILGIDEGNIREGYLATSISIQLGPNESLFVEYYVTVPGSFQGDTGVITLTISCENHDSYENLEFETVFELNVLTSSFLDNLSGFFKTFFFVGLVALVLGAAYYGFKTYQKLQEVPEKERESRPRRGRYVEVAKLQKQPEESETDLEEVEEKTADLDDLLKEEGLED